MGQSPSGEGDLPDQRGTGEGIFPEPVNRIVGAEVVDTKDNKVTSLAPRERDKG